MFFNIGNLLFQVFFQKIEKHFSNISHDLFCLNFYREISTINVGFTLEYGLQNSHFLAPKRGVALKLSWGQAPRPLFFSLPEFSPFSLSDQSPVIHCNTFLEKIYYL